MRKIYTNVAIPVDLAQEVNKIITKSKVGCISRAQFVIEAIREKIKQECL